MLVQSEIDFGNMILYWDGPTNPGKYSILCNEYCGIGHHTMTGKIYVTEPKRTEADQRLTAGR